MENSQVGSWMSFVCSIQRQIAGGEVINSQDFRQFVDKLRGKEVDWDGLLVEKAVSIPSDGEYVVVSMPVVVVEFPDGNSQKIESIVISVADDPQILQEWQECEIGQQVHFTATLGNEVFAPIRLVKVGSTKHVLILNLSNGRLVNCLRRSIPT